jgi:hypothetical protein
VQQSAAMNEKEARLMESGERKKRMRKRERER